MPDPAADIQRDNAPKETDVYVESSNQTFLLDDPEQRRRYTELMTAQEKERFAKWYVRSLLETKEEVVWFRRMTNPSLHKIYKDTYESGGMIPLRNKVKEAINYDQ